MYISEIQCQKLDKILSAFGDGEYLDIDLVTAIEPIERKANGLIEILNGRGLITRIGDSEENVLPMILLLNPVADVFMDNGGFTAEFRRTSKTNHITINSTGNGNIINTGDNNEINNTHS